MMVVRRLLPVLWCCVLGCVTPEPSPVAPDTDTEPVCPPLPEPGPFRIVVLGDRTGGPNDAIFKAILNEAARLRPDMVVSVGDLIRGYQPDDRIDEARAEWRGVLGDIRRAFGDVPLVVTPGNHDVWSDPSEALFEELVGHPVNTAIDVGPSRLIVLDNSRAESEGELSDEQLDWLVRQLARAQDRAQRIVVMHRPLWAIDPGGKAGSPLHDVLIAGRADLVLTGHWHHAMSDVRDDVNYQLLGPSGGVPHQPDHPETGHFQQYGMLLIDRQKAEFSLIRAGSILDDEAFPYALNQLEWQIRYTAVTSPDFEFDPLRPSKAGRFSVRVHNATQHEMDDVLRFAERDASWRITPRTQKIALNAGESARFEFRYNRPPGATLNPGPRFSLAFPLSRTVMYQLQSELRPTLYRRIRRVRSGPVIDGRLDDAVWRQATAVGSLTMERASRPDPHTSIRACYLSPHLFIGVELADSDMDGLRELLATADGIAPWDHFQLSVNINPKQLHRIRLLIDAAGRLSAEPLGFTEQPSIDWQGRHLFAVTQGESGWTLELALPLDEFFGDELPARLPINFKRTRLREGYRASAQWQPATEDGPPTFGLVYL